MFVSIGSVLLDKSIDAIVLLMAVMFVALVVIPDKSMDAIALLLAVIALLFAVMFVAFIVIPDKSMDAIWSWVDKIKEEYAVPPIDIFVIKYPNVLGVISLTTHLRILYFSVVVIVCEILKLLLSFIISLINT